MKNRDTILLEEAYNKTRLLKEESVDDFNSRKMKEDRLDRQDQHAIDQADTEVAPGLKTSSSNEMNDGDFLDNITRKLAEIGNVIADQFPEEAKYLISLDSELNSLKDKLGRD
jgi:hypothetical protein